MRGTADPHNLHRFLDAQSDTFYTAYRELVTGRKHGHWMWFVFPQVAGLGSSAMAQDYAINSLDEARAYLAHPTLGARLHACAEALLALGGADALSVFGYPDHLKLRSSMTLFELVAEPDDPFRHVLERYFDGERDPLTLEIVERWGSA
jgi:uncharacterized protein (DUF1810 family)